MKKIVNHTLIFIFLSMLLGNCGHAFDVDETVDDEIRKNYNPSKLIQDSGINHSALEKNMQEDIKNSNYKLPDENLPALPNIIQSTKTSDVKSSNIVPQNSTVPYKGGHIRVKKGSSFDVVSLTGVSDWQAKGTTVKFTVKKNIYRKRYTIPANTVFVGEVIESHQPQITCNGGLVAIQINSMIYKNQVIPISGYITRANDKKIFFNDIKGQRTYLKTMWKKGNWGRTLFNKMMTLTVSLGASGSTVVLSPFPFAYGTICLGMNAITSPICAFFSKGGHVSIPVGSAYRIKLTEDVMIN